MLRNYCDIQFPLQLFMIKIYFPPYFYHEGKKKKILNTRISIFIMKIQYNYYYYIWEIFYPFSIINKKLNTILKGKKVYLVLSRQLFTFYLSIFACTILFSTPALLPSSRMKDRSVRKSALSHMIYHDAVSRSVQ